MDHRIYETVSTDDLRTCWKVLAAMIQRQNLMISSEFAGINGAKASVADACLERAEAETKAVA